MTLSLEQQKAMAMAKARQRQAQAAQPAAQAAQPQDTILSPRAQQLPQQQQEEIIRGLQAQRSAVGAPVQDLGPTASSRTAQALEVLREENPELAKVIENLTPLESAGVGLQSGLRTVGRGAGKLVGADVFGDVNEPAVRALRETSRAAAFGELAGQVAPFAAISPFAAIPRTIAGRAAAGGALGGSEGAAISAGQDRGGKEIALATGLSVLLGGGGEVLLPVINRAFRKRARELGVSTDNALTPEGTLTQDVSLKLREKGIDEESFIRRALNDADISKAQKKSIIDGLGEAKLSSGIPATRGEFLQSQGEQDAFRQLKLEQQMLESSGEAGDKLRAFKLRQSEDAEKLIQGLSPGDASILGPSIRDAVELRESSAKFARSQAYKKLGEATRDLDVGLSVRAVGDSMPDARRLRVFDKTNPGQSGALQDILAEFGVVSPPAGFKGEITPVSVSNYEDLRQILNDIEKSDITGRTSSISGPIKQALDAEFEIASKALEATGEASVAAAAKSARLSNVALKTEFDPKGMVDQLIALKPGGSRIPKIEDSKIYSKLIAESTPIEQFSSVVGSLNRAASKGALAKNQLKSRMILDLLDSGFQAKTRKIQGQEVFGATPFVNRLNRMRPKLEKIFSPEEMVRLDTFAKDAKNLIPPTGTTPLGSSGFFIDALDKMGVWRLADAIAPGVGGVVGQQLKNLGRTFRSEKDLARALRAPKAKEVTDLITSDYPALSAALLPAILLEEQ